MPLWWRGDHRETILSWEHCYEFLPSKFYLGLLNSVTMREWVCCFKPLSVQSLCLSTLTCCSRQRCEPKWERKEISIGHWRIPLAPACSKMELEPFVPCLYPLGLDLGPQTHEEFPVCFKDNKKEGFPKANGVNQHLLNWNHKYALRALNRGTPVARPVPHCY